VLASSITTLVKLVVLAWDYTVDV